MTKVAVQHIANTCSSLEKIRFESCTKITDDVILALMKSNPQLVMLEVRAKGGVFHSRGREKKRHVSFER